MIKLSEITYNYPRNGKTIFKDFSLDIQTGNIYGLLGKNGAGKTTLLYLLCGLLTPKKGEALMDGKKIRQRHPEVMQQIFLVPEEFTFPSTSLKHYIQSNACFYPNFSMEDMENNLNAFEMEKDIQLDKLSMGQKKKVFISFALATNTPYLIMDEPTNGLDILGKSQFRKIISSNMTEEKTLIISTHQVRDIDQLLDHLIVIDNSKVLIDASVNNISQHLQCVQSNDPTLLKQAIYALPSLQGNQLLLPNPTGEDTPLNLELLFGAALSQPETIAQYLKGQTP